MPDAIAAKALPLLRKRSCGMDENCAHFDANKTNKLLRIISSCGDEEPSQLQGYPCPR